MVVNSKTEGNSTKIDTWFNDFIEKLEATQFLLKQDMVTPETKEFWNAVMDDNVDEVLRYSDLHVKMHFIKKMTLELLMLLYKEKLPINKIALDVEKSKVLTWVELKNDDEPTEDRFIMLEAEINSRYAKDGYYISSTIVEERDNLRVPSHYNSIEI